MKIFTIQTHSRKNYKYRENRKKTAGTKRGAHADLDTPGRKGYHWDTGETHEETPNQDSFLTLAGFLLMQLAIIHSQSTHTMVSSAGMEK